MQINRLAELIGRLENKVRLLYSILMMFNAKDFQPISLEKAEDINTLLALELKLECHVSSTSSMSTFMC